MGDLIPLSAAPSLRAEGDSRSADSGPGPLSVDTRGKNLRAEGDGRSADSGPVIIDRRGKNNGTAGRVAAERAAREQKRQAQETWTKQAAATMWWSAQRSGTPAPIAERILAKREELLAGARKQKILRA